MNYILVFKKILLIYRHLLVSERRHLFKLLIHMKLIIMFVFAFGCQIFAGVSAQKVTLTIKNGTIAQALETIQKQTQFNFSYNDELLNNAKPVSIQVVDMNLDLVMQKLLKNQPFQYEIMDDIIIVKQRAKNNLNSEPSAVQTSQAIIQLTVVGHVQNEKGEALEGASIFVLDNQGKRTNRQAKTNVNGYFELGNVQNGEMLELSYLGYQNIKIEAKPQVGVIQLKVLSAAMDAVDIVSTGIYTRDKESFTGSATTYTGEELKTVGNLNIIQSLKTLDPVFAVLENNQFGSDPNRLPDLEIRGKSSIVGLKEEFEVDPNQPLFILDGFETTLRTIVDLDLERIESVTILKDAASTAIYGSRAANGVVVVETKAPLPGQLRLSYTSNFNISAPDFSSYNLMNSEEKLQFELLAGRYTINNWDASNNTWDLYNKRLQNVANGVDTYWLADPVRTGINHRQTIYAEGGDQAMRYGIGANYNNNNGVMKSSNRSTFSGNIDLIYRKNKFLFSNKLTIDQTNSTDPLVPFSEYSRANPYYPKYNEEGFVDKWLENTTADRVSNPLWNASLNSRMLGKTFGIVNNFSAEYTPTDSWRLRARLGVNKSSQENDNFVSPQNTQFDNLDPLLKGVLTYGNTQQLSLEGEFTTSYAVVLQEKHRINTVAGTRIRSSEALENGYTAQGFSDGDYVTAAFAKGYPENGRPRYSERESREASFFLNGGYSFSERYLMDVTYRLSGSSVFGSNKRFANTWSTGLAWNMHNENFVKEGTPWINLLKLRASIGNPGNQNFSAYQTFTTYSFSNQPATFFGPGVTLNTLGNPDLKWQTTLDKNIGMDASFINRRLSLNFDYFNKLTDPLLINIGVASSLGINEVLTNLGLQQSEGFNGMVTFSPIYRPAERIVWSLRYNFRTEKSKLDKIGNALEKFNEGGRNLSTVRYFDGANPDAIWTVRSAGIDPASGQEIFYKKNGDYSLTYDYADEVQVGIARPKIQGVFGTSVSYKGFSANVDFRYRYGGQAFNSALFQKVENITLAGLRLNQDKRALYDRWQKPGDISDFKGISLSDPTLMSSRFVDDDNSIALESLRVGYEFRTDWMKQVGIKQLRLNAYMNDLFVISSIKTERGIDYPFARTVSFSASISL